jgi:hypothetical protein
MLPKRLEQTFNRMGFLQQLEPMRALFGEMWL